MAKDDIQKLLDDANKVLDAEYDNQSNAVKSEIKSFRAKTIEKISKNIP